MKTFSLTRQSLYEQVWSKPMVTLAKEFNLSDKGLREICKKNDIPIPPMGHWQKIQYGKKISKIPLPKKSSEGVIKINVEEIKLNSHKSIPTINSVSEVIKNNKSLILKVSERLNSPDDIILKTQINLNQRQGTDSYSAIKGTIQTDRGFPSIIVSPKNISRSLRILDNLIKNFRVLGYNVVLKDEGLSVIAYDNDEIKVYIREKSNSIKLNDNYWQTRELVPNGKLALKVARFGTYEFVDTSKRLVEDQIENILIKIESDFKDMHERRQMFKIEQQEREILKKIEQDKQQIKIDELNKFIEFYKNAHRWKKYIILQEYFDFINNQSDKSIQTDVWLEWAKQKLDWYNPMFEVKDELLFDVDKDILAFKKKH